MNIQEAQDKLYELSEDFGYLRDQIGVLNDEADKVNDERRELLYQFPILDIRRIGDRERAVYSEEQIKKWGDGILAAVKS